MPEKSDISIRRRDYRILYGIYDAGKISGVDLSRKIKISQAVISINIQKFLDSNMVSYDIPKSNRTHKLFFLTNEGKTFLAGLKRIFEEC
jgi:DNA-binding MarR family transcriptional regulator